MAWTWTNKKPGLVVFVEMPSTNVIIATACLKACKNGLPTLRTFSQDESAQMSAAVLCVRAGLLLQELHEISVAVSPTPFIRSARLKLGKGIEGKRLSSVLLACIEQRWPLGVSHGSARAQTPTCRTAFHLGRGVQTAHW